jgi:hypothetical protein
MIEARGLTKFYGERAAVSNLSFTVRPGVVTGFLGPNGAGKPVTGLRQEIGLGQRCGVPLPEYCLACLPAGPAAPCRLGTPTMRGEMRPGPACVIP